MSEEDDDAFAPLADIVAEADLDETTVPAGFEDVAPPQAWNTEAEIHRSVGARA